MTQKSNDALQHPGDQRLTCDDAVIW